MLDRIVKLLEVESIRNEQMRSALDPVKMRMSSPAIYRFITNCDEIEHKLGSEERGFLFR